MNQNSIKSQDVERGYNIVIANTNYFDIGGSGIRITVVHKKYGFDLRPIIKEINAMNTGYHIDAYMEILPSRPGFMDVTIESMGDGELPAAIYSWLSRRPEYEISADKTRAKTIRPMAYDIDKRFGDAVDGYLSDLENGVKDGAIIEDVLELRELQVR